VFIARFDGLLIEVITSHYNLHQKPERFMEVLLVVLGSKYYREYIDRAFVMALCDVYNNTQEIGIILTEEDRSMLRKVVKGHNNNWVYNEEDQISFLETNLKTIVDSFSGIENQLKVTMA